MSILINVEFSLTIFIFNKGNTDQPRSLIIDDKLFNNLITCSFIIIFTVILEQNLLKMYLLFYKQNFW